MKYGPKVAAGMLFASICVSGNYWIRHFSGISSLPIREIVPQAQPSPHISAARGLFGERIEIVATRQYQLSGVIFSGAVAERMAIISVNAKPANVVRNGEQVDLGVTLKEVNRVYVVLSDERGDMRIEFPQTGLALQANSSADEPLTPMAGANPASHADHPEKIIERAKTGVPIRPAPLGLSRSDLVPSVPGVIRPAPPARAS